MDFYAILDQVVALLRQRQRVTYRALKRHFALDDDARADLTAELLAGPAKSEAEWVTNGTHRWGALDAP
jgi:hypothetical protein